MGCSEAAVDYCLRGWSVVPLCPADHAGCSAKHKAECDRPGKGCRVRWKGSQEKRASEESVRKWWADWPDSNVGVCLGPVSGLLGLDVDGIGGAALYEEWRGSFPVPLTLTFVTPNGGRRELYRHPVADVTIRSARDAEK